MVNRRLWWLAGIALVCLLLVGSWWFGRDSKIGSTRASQPEANASAEADTGDPASGGASAEPGAIADATDEPGTPPVTDVAPDGEPFEQITEPPGPTTAMFDPDAMPIDTRLSVEFQPYGVGPWGDESLVIRLAAVSVIDNQDLDVSRLEGSNVIVNVGPDAASSVTQGGTYTGILRAVPQQDVTILTLEEASRQSAQ